MGKVDIAFLGFALFPHHIDGIAGLELGLALVVQHFGQRQHAFRLGANIDHDVGGGQLQHRALEDVVLTGGFFALCGEGFQRGGEIFHGGWFFVLVLGRRWRLGVKVAGSRALKGARAFLDHGCRCRGIRIVSGVIVEQS